jgi:hypothetical protein
LRVARAPFPQPHLLPGRRESHHPKAAMLSPLQFSWPCALGWPFLCTFMFPIIVPLF